MYMWIRLIMVLATAWRRPPLKPPFGISKLKYRAWPFDIDMSMHMNNSRYAVLADMGRMDLILRSGLWRIVAQKKLSPILKCSTIRYRREIRNFDPFTVETRALYWDDTDLYMEHKFTLTGGKHAGQVSAIMIAKVAMYDRQNRTFISNDELLKYVGIQTKSPPMPDAVAAMKKTDEAIRQVTAVERIEELSA